MDRIASMPASQTRSVSYRIGEAASGGMGAISQPANQSESGPGQNEKVSQRAFLDRCTPESGRCFERGERQLRANRRHSTFAISGKGLAYSYPSPMDHTPRRDWNETSPPKAISASGLGRC